MDGVRCARTDLTFRVLVLSMVLALSCAAPYFERAKLERGWSDGIGVGVGGGSFASIPPFRDPDELYYCSHVAAKATLFGRYNFSRRFGLFMQIATGAAYEFSGSRDPGFGHFFPGWWLLFEMADIELGTKVGLGDRDALRIDLGTVYLFEPALADVVWLHDLNDSWTTNLGLGTRGLIVGAGYHFPLSDWATGHLSLTGTLTATPRYWGDPAWDGLTPRATGQLGFALEPWPRR